MALVEKSHGGKWIRLAALVMAVAVVVWLAAFLLTIQPESVRLWRLSVVIVVMFAALAWWRWRLVVDVALVNLPLWIMLPMRMGVQNFSLVEIALLAGLAGGAIRVAQTGRLRWFATPLTPYLALMAVVGCLSLALSCYEWRKILDPIFLRLFFGDLISVFSRQQGALRAVLTLLGGFVFYHAIVARVRDIRAARHVIQLSLLSAVLVAAFGIGQFFFNWNRVDFKPWSHRINSTFPDVNSLASFLVANFFMLLPLLTTQRRWRPRGMAWLVLPILCVALYMAHSRIAFGALAVTLPLYVALSSGGLQLEKPVVWLYKKRFFLAAAYVAGLVTLGFVLMGLDWVYHTDLHWMRSSGIAARQLKGRLNIWRRALYSTAESPWFGTGIGGFPYSVLGHYENADPPDEWNWNPPVENAHNYFIQVLTETGVVGVGIFAMILGLVFYQGLRAIAMRKSGERRLFAGLMCGIVAFLLTWLTGHPLLLVDVNLWFWAMVAVLFVPHASESAEMAAAQVKRGPWQLFLLATVLLAATGRFVEVAKSPRPLFYGYGIHATEFLEPAAQRYAYNWLSKRAVFRMYQLRPGIEFCVRNVLAQGHPIAVTIRVNGRQIDQFTLGDGSWRLCSYSLPETVHSLIKLEILSDYEWVPAPPDRRRLAIQAQWLHENLF